MRSTRSTLRLRSASLRHSSSFGLVQVRKHFLVVPAILCFPNVRFIHIKFLPRPSASNHVPQSASLATSFRRFVSRLTFHLASQPTNHFQPLLRLRPPPPAPAHLLGLRPTPPARRTCLFGAPIIRSSALIHIPTALPQMGLFLSLFVLVMKQRFFNLVLS